MREGALVGSSACILNVVEVVGLMGLMEVGLVAAVVVLMEGKAI